jgi:hypothetical protein
MRHLVFVHDSWFRRCCLGSMELFTPMGIGTTVEPYRGAHGLDLSLDPALDEIVSVRDICPRVRTLMRKLVLMSSAMGFGLRQA